MKKLIILSFLVLLVACQEENNPPTCTIIYPEGSDDFEIGEVVTISVDAEDPDGSISEVRFYIDGIGVGSTDIKRYRIGTTDIWRYWYDWNTTDSELGDHSIKAIAYDNEGLNSSDKASIKVVLTIPVPTLTTNLISEVTTTSATGGGNVTAAGNPEITTRGICWSTSQNPTTADYKTDDGTGKGSFTSNLTGLTKSTTYYVRAYATYSDGTSYGDEVILRTYEATVTDYDGNEYWTVIIGDQEWMAENMKTTRYADGSAIPYVEGSTEWVNLKVIDRAYCWYDNSDSLRDIYGGLYTWAAAMNGANSSDANPSSVQGVCPDGWHLPSDAEWRELEMFLGMRQADTKDIKGMRGTDEGGKLKETGIKHWNDPNEGATNESGFTALSSGYRHLDGGYPDAYGDYYYFGPDDYYEVNNALFWTAREYDESFALGRVLYSVFAAVGKNYFYKGDGFSVRCVKDQE